MNRLHEFDALRGIAAIAVVFAHVLNYLPYGTPDPLKQSHSFFFSFAGNGHFAVMIFFAISGFVLTYPYFTGVKDERNLVIDSLNRLPRLLIPVFTTAILCFALQRGAALIAGGEFPGLFAKPHWVMHWSVADWSLSRFWEFLFGGIFVYYSESDTFNVNLWTMPVEFAMSFAVFAVVALWMRHFVIAAVLVGMAAILISTWRAEPVELFLKSIYSGAFFLGIGAAFWQEPLKRWYARRRWASFILIPLGLLLSHALMMDDMHYLLANGLAVIGIICFFLSFCGLQNIGKVLSGPFWQYLGEVSFALYLVHGSVLYFVFMIGAPLFEHHDKTSYLLLASIGITASFLLAYLIAHYVELPAVKIVRRWLGKQIPRKANA